MHTLTTEFSIKPRFIVNTFLHFLKELLLELLLVCI